MKIRSKLALSSILLGGATMALPGVYAQDNEGATLEEIIVTAQKRTQNVRDIAGSVNVITGAHIAEYNTFNFIDLERISSGLTLTQANPRNVAIALRGITQNPESGTAPAVDVYQNNVTQRPDNIFGALYDMGQVEVLRGAQGSEQGATSPAGAIILHTTKPDLAAFGGYVQTTYATHNGFNAQGAYSIPIIKDQLSFRIAGYYDQNDGNNTVNLASGNVQKRDNTSYRASLRWQPTDNFELNLVYQDNDESILGTPALQGARTTSIALGPVPGIPCTRSATNSCRTLTADNNTALAANDAFANRDAQITTLNLNWAFGKHQLSYAFGRTEASKASRTENDASNNLPQQNAAFVRLGVTTDTNYLTHQNATTMYDDDLHELLFASIDNPFWNYMVGAYYHDQKSTTRFDAWSTAARYIPLSRLDPIDFDRDPSTLPLLFFTGGHIEGINFSTGGVIPFEIETSAVFTAHSFQFTDKMQLEAAVRYQQINQFRAVNIAFSQFNEEANISVQNATATIGETPEMAGAAPDALVNPVAQGALQGTLAAIMGTNIIGVPEQYQSPSPTAITGSVHFKYDVNDSIKSYVFWSRGFRAGGISITPGTALLAADTLFNDETSDSFEVGTKLILAGGKAEINVAVYHQIFDGYLGYVTGLTHNPSANATLPDMPDINEEADVRGGIVYNADATTSGIEVEGRMIIGGNWLIGGSFSYIKAELDNALVPCNVRTTATVQLGRCESSARIPGSPEISANLFAEYSHAFGATRLFVRANGKYNGGIIATRATNDGTSPGETESFTLVDLFVGVQNANMEVSAWAKNLFNDDTLVDLTNSGDDFDVGNHFSVVRRQQERIIGVTAKYHF